MSGGRSRPRAEVARRRGTRGLPQPLAQRGSPQPLSSLPGLGTPARVALGDPFPAWWPGRAGWPRGRRCSLRIPVRRPPALCRSREAASTRSLKENTCHFCAWGLGFSPPPRPPWEKLGSGEARLLLRESVSDCVGASLVFLQLLVDAGDRGVICVL